MLTFLFVDSFLTWQEKPGLRRGRSGRAPPSVNLTLLKNKVNHRLVAYLKRRTRNGIVFNCEVWRGKGSCVFLHCFPGDLFVWWEWLNGSYAKCLLT